MGIAFDNSGSTAVTTGQTSATLDITSAVAGAWCYAWVAVGSSNAGSPSIAATGWTVVQGAADSTTAEYAVLRRQKVAGDTTFTVTWTTSAHAELVWASWTGADPNTPDEASAITTNGTTSRTAVPTPTATPNAGDRWAVGFFAARTSTSGNKNITWTPDAAQTERVDANNQAGASSVWFGNEIADTNGAVTQTSQSYTATHAPAAESHDGSAILFLIPAPAGSPPPFIYSPPGRMSPMAFNLLPQPVVSYDIAASGPNGTVQPLATRQPRRSSARAVWKGFVSSTTNLYNGTVPPKPVVARRSTARVVWKGFVSSTTNLLNGNNPDGVVYRRRAARAVIYGRAVPPQIPVPASGRLVARRTAARAVWRGFISSTTNLYNGNPPDGVVYRRKSARAVVHGNPAPFPPPIGTVPDHLVIARRSTARAVWHGSAVPPQVARTAQGKSVARRLPARAVWYPTRTSTTNLLSGDQPGSGLVRRRQSARAVWAGTVSRTINVQPTVSGTAPLHLVVARRGSARAVWKGFVSSTTNLLYGNPPDGLVKRRSTARAVWAGTVSRTVNAIPTVSGTVPDHLVVARRASARAFWRGFVSKTTNAVPGSVQPAPTAPVRRHVPARVVWRGNAVPGQQPHPETGGLVRRRIPARGTFHGNTGSPPPPPVSGSIAPPPRVVSRRPPSRGQWRGVTVRTTNAIPVAVRAPRQRLTVPRRTSARAEWAGTVSRTQNAVATIRFSLGIPGFRWKTSSPDKNWQVP